MNYFKVAVIQVVLMRALKSVKMVNGGGSRASTGNLFKKSVLKPY